MKVILIIVGGACLAAVVVGLFSLVDTQEPLLPVAITDSPGNAIKDGKLRVAIVDAPGNAIAPIVTATGNILLTEDFMVDLTECKTIELYAKDVVMGAAINEAGRAKYAVTGGYSLKCAEK